MINRIEFDDLMMNAQGTLADLDQIRALIPAGDAVLSGAELGPIVTAVEGAVQLALAMGPQVQAPQ